MNRRQAVDSFQKSWELCYPNLTEYIINLHNYLKKKQQKVKHYITVNKSTTMIVPPWNGQ